MNAQDITDFKKVQTELHRLAELAEGDFQNSAKGFVNMYAIVYNAATRSRIDDADEQYAAAEELYKHFQELLTEAVNRQPIDTRQPREVIFSHALRKWSHFKILQKWMLKTFHYISRYYVAHCNKKPLEYVALSIFYTNVFKHVSSTVSHILLQNVNKERRGEEVDKEAIRLAVEMFTRMGFEEKIPKLEYVEPLRAMTADYYKKEAVRCINEDSATTYCQKASRWLAEEQQRAERFLPDETLQQELIHVVEDEVLLVHQTKLLNNPTSGFVALLEHDRQEDLKLMFSLMARLKGKGIEPMAELIGKHSRSEGQTIMKQFSGGNDADFKGYIEAFINLHERYMSLLGQCFGGTAAFQATLKDAFESTINRGITLNSSSGADGSSMQQQPSASGMSRENTTLMPQTSSTVFNTNEGTFNVPAAELLSNYIDGLVKNSSEKLSDDEIEEQFTKLVSLFNRVIDKDLVQEHMRKHLSRRLLTSGFNIELEKALILKFKTKCGASFTSRFEGMLNDKTFSAEVNSEFREHLEGKATLGAVGKIDFTTQVLTTGFWPTFNTVQMNPPAPIQMLMTIFRDYYMARGMYQHRVLVWIHSLGNVSMTAAFPKGNKELQMSVFQAVVLYLFNEKTSMTLKEVMDATGLDWDEVRRVVQSFTQSRVKIMVRRAENAQQVKEEDVLAPNDEFAHQQKKIKMPVAIQRVTQQNTAQVQGQVEEDRKPAINACIVRIMKSRKTLDHQLLVADVIAQLSSRFKPEPKLIKQQIEDLINREYIERSSTSASTYVYLAC